jgi:hypothetical protein
MKRRFWQIHLSTAVVLVLSAGALMYVNTIPILKDGTEAAPTKSNHVHEFFGWPWYYWRMDAIFISLNDTNFIDRSETDLEINNKLNEAFPPLTITYFIRDNGYVIRNPSSNRPLKHLWMLANAGVAILILFVIALGCEWIIRSRERGSLLKEPR